MKFALCVCVLFTLPGCSTPQEFHGERWETLQVVPRVSGIRVEEIAGSEHPAFLGYTAAGESVVEPETPMNIVVFGYWLDKVDYVTFTDSNCITSEFNITSKDFDLQTERRIEFKMSFMDVEESWRMCVKQKGKGGELLLVDEIHTWISTSATLPVYYMPLPVQFGILAVLFCMSALFSGLNLGLMSLSTNELQLIQKCGEKNEREYARVILPIRRRGNYLLCTILIMNVVVNASISILFEDLTSGTIAFITSSIGIVILGEICPQSFCVKQGLAVGAKTLFLTKFFMFITFPLSWPISKVLDKLLGEEVDQFDRNRLLELMKLQSHQPNADAADIRIAVGAMEIAKKTARDVMTKIEDVFMLSSDTVLNANTMAEIVKKGYTRIPIYEGNDRNTVISLLFVKDLALVNKSMNITVQTVSGFHNHKLRIVSEVTPLTELLQEFKTGEYHLAMVKKDSRNISGEDSPTYLRNALAQFEQNDIGLLLMERLSEEEPQIIGLVTLEDIIEEILQAEIIDESDAITDNVQRQKRQFEKNSMDMSQIFGKEKPGEVLTLHAKDVLCRFMREHHPLFSKECMEQRALEMLIDKNVRKVEIVTEKNVNLYNVGEPSRRAIVILEGSGQVYFPKSNMRLTTGPWIALGDVLLNNLEALVINRPMENPASVFFVPDFEVQIEKYCKFVQFPVASILHALKISKALRAIRSPSRTPNSDNISVGSKSVRFKENMQYLEEPPRERNGSVQHLLCTSEQKHSDTRKRSVSTLSAERNRIN